MFYEAVIELTTDNKFYWADKEPDMRILLTLFDLESIWRGNFTKYLFLGYGLLENRMCSYKISRKLSWEIWSVLRYFFLLENLMCSNEILDKISWKLWSVLMIFLPPGKSYVFLRNFEKALLEILMCSSKIARWRPGGIFSSPLQLFQWY